MSWNGLLELLGILVVLEIITVAKIAYYAFPHRHLTHACCLQGTFFSYTPSPSLVNLYYS